MGCSLFSAILYFDSLGRYLGKHRKILPMASECAVWWSGEKSLLPVYETPIGKIGGLICWDNRIPPLRTELYAKGIPFVIVTYCFIIFTYKRTPNVINVFFIVIWFNHCIVQYKEMAFVCVCLYLVLLSINNVSSFITDSESVVF
jgi:hypothetical protein